MTRLQPIRLTLPLLALCGLAHAAPYPFSDGFEGGLLYWSATGDWGTTPVVAHTGQLSATDSHGSFYQNNVDASLSLASGIDLTTATLPALGFYHRYSLETGYDYGRVEVSTNGGVNWSPLSGAVFTGETAEFVREQFDLSPYAGQPDFRIRFRIQTDASVQRDGWYVDDVVVAEAPIPVTLAVPTPVSGTRIDLSWSASSAPDFATYRIYRAMTLGTPWQQAHFVAEVTSIGNTTYSDMTVGPKSTYCY